MARVLSCVNLKGGVGKTALAVNFAIYCGMKGKRTLLVDLDPQTNATFCCITVEEWERHAADHGSVADLLGARRLTNAEDAPRPASEVIVKNVFTRVDLVPSHLDLFTVDLDLAHTVARETKLRRALEPLMSNYDIIVCDCPPNLTLPTQNALAMSTDYVVPVTPDYLSGIGVGLLLNRIAQLSQDLENNIAFQGIVISRVGRPAQHREQTVAAIRAQFGAKVFSSEIRELVAVSEAAARQTPVYEYQGAAAEDFLRVSGELTRRLGI